MNEIFNFHGQEVRTLTIDNDPWFVGKDVADILGYSNSKDALSKHVDTDDKQVIQRSQNATFDIPNRGLTIINESGLYSLILSSKLPQAKEFKRWVTSEVLPTIRRRGAYVTNQKAIEITTNPSALADFLQGITDQVKILEHKNEILQHELREAQKQARYLDLIIESKASLRVTQIAADYGMSAAKFNHLLHKLKVQHKVNNQWILYRKHMGKGYVDSATFDFIDGKGQARTHITTTWTQKGRLFLYELLKENGILPLIEQNETI